MADQPGQGYIWGALGAFVGAVLTHLRARPWRNGRYQRLSDKLDRIEERLERIEERDNVLDITEAVLRRLARRT